MKADYRGTQDALYEACGILVLSLLEELATFTGFKAKYTVGWVSDFKAKIKAAKKLPDEDQRAEEHELLRVELVSRQVKCIDLLQALRLYIKEAFPDKEVQRIKLQAAGFNDYDAAAERTWEKLISIMENSVTFINANLADLLAGNNMPPDFQAKVEAQNLGLADLVEQFKNTLENTKQGTQEKLIANNEIYKIATGVCEDGYYLFKDDEAKRDQFNWDKISDLVSPPGAAGLRLDAKEQGTNEPLPGVEVVIQLIDGGTPLTKTTDADGNAYYPNLTVGKYNGRLKLTGYNVLDVELEIKTGVTSFKHWTLVKI